MLAAGCSGKKAKDPQLNNLRLTSDLIESLSKNDHKAAASRAAKLRTILPESSFLSMLEECETGNIYIAQAQPLLDKGDLEGANKIIDKGLEDHPMNRYLAQSRAQLQLLAKFQKALETAMHPMGAVNLQESIAEIKELGAAYPKSTFIPAFIAAREKDALVMEKHELKRAYDSLVAEYRILSKTDPALAGVLAAQIAYEKDHPDASRM